MAYGEFLLRSPSGEMRYLNAIIDSVFREVDNLIGHDERIRKFDQFQRADILYQVFGTACDPDSQGKDFVIGEWPPCTRCGSHTVVEWEAVEPVSCVDLNVQPATHSEWQSLNEDEKKSRIRESLGKALSRNGIR
jgi:hypothetical protein